MFHPDRLNLPNSGYNDRQILPENQEVIAARLCTVVRQLISGYNPTESQRALTKLENPTDMLQCVIAGHYDPYDTEDRGTLDVAYDTYLPRHYLYGLCNKGVRYIGLLAMGDSLLLAGLDQRFTYLDPIENPSGLVIASSFLGAVQSNIPRPALQTKVPC